MSHRALVMAAAGALLLAGAAAAAPDRASAGSAVAAPDLMIFHGGALEEPIRITTWEENHRILLGLEALDTASMGELKRGLARRGLVPVDTAGRASVEVALFWHPVASKLKERGVPKEQWPVKAADQRARFFPATANQPALWVWTVNVPASRPVARLTGVESLEILTRHGVPVRAE